MLYDVITQMVYSLSTLGGVRPHPCASLALVVLLGNPTGLSWPNNRVSEIFLQLLPESVQRRS